MQKLKVILLLAVLAGGVYFGYGYLNQAPASTQLTVAEGQTLFDQAFLASQENTQADSKSAQYDINLALSVKDNANDVLPAKLEQLSGTIYLNYDFENELNVYAETIVEFFLNGSKLPDFGFMASLKEKNFSYTLTNFDIDAGIFLGLDELLGGTSELETLRDSFVGQTQNIRLKDSEYREIVRTLTNAPEDSELVVNTADQEKAIVQSFVDQKVIQITTARKNIDGYELGFAATGPALVSFLNDVAEINGLENDFASELPMLEKISMTGIIKLDSAQKISQINSDILVKRALLNSAEKDLLFNLNYQKSDNTDKFVLTLLDAIKNTEQAKFEIGVKKD